MGHLTILTGCMFSGKTTELLRRVAATPVGSVRVFKQAMDDRYRRDAVVAHTGEMADAEVVCGAEEIAAAVFAVRAVAENPPQSPLAKGGGKRLVAIDEAHFFEIELCVVIETLRASGVDVVVTALDRGSWGQRFPVVDRLLELADERVPMFAVCARCGGRAEWTQRLTPIVEGRLVGGPEAYEPRCAKCWHKPPEAAPKEECRMSNSE